MMAMLEATAIAGRILRALPTGSTARATAVRTEMMAMLEATAIVGRILRGAQPTTTQPNRAPNLTEHPT